MSEQRKVLLRIMLFIARLVNDDESVSSDLRNLTNHINTQNWSKRNDN